MDVHDISIPKKQLESLPDNERVLVLQFGHVCNELSFLNKLLLVANDFSSKGMERKAMVAQSMIIVRLFAGKLFEAWRMIERDYFKSQLSRSLDAKLSPEGKSALEALKQYFGRTNVLSSLRNDFSFHYWSEHLPEAMKAFDDSYKFHLILGETYANTCHAYAEDLVTVAMLQAAGASDAKAAMEKVVGDLVFVGGKMIDFLGHALAAVFESRLGKSWDDFEYTVNSIEPDAHIETFKLPFFFELGHRNAS